LFFSMFCISARIPGRRHRCRVLWAVVAVAFAPCSMYLRQQHSISGLRTFSVVDTVGQLIAATNFYFYGRKHFTETGWLKHSARYPSHDPLEAVNLAGRVYVITGANSGIGKEIAFFLAERGARLHLVCRNATRGREAREEILAKAPAGAAVVVNVADISLQRDVRRIAAAIAAEEPRGIDGLVCNAGALQNKRTLTDEGIEVTFASHFLFGSYLLAELMKPSLRASAAAGRDPRVIMVSSGGMYTTRFPAWNAAASLPAEAGGKLPRYNGQLAYAYAKRGQVLLCERWAEEEAERQRNGVAAILYISAHPGWTRTPAAIEAYGDQIKYLEPMRDTWAGAEGICWLCIAPSSSLEPGAFYLDRSPQVKHIAGLFFTEGTFTKNSRAEVDCIIKEAARASHAVL